MKRMLYIVCCYCEDDDIVYYELRPGSPTASFIMDMCYEGVNETLKIDGMEEGDWIKCAYEVVPMLLQEHLTGKFGLRFVARPMRSGADYAYCKTYSQSLDRWGYELFCPQDTVSFLRPDAADEWAATLEIIEYS